MRDARLLVLDDVAVLDPFHLVIVATGEIIPAFAGAGGGGGPPPPPEPSPEERRAFAKQAEASDLYIQLAKRQAATAEALEPYFFRQLGLRKVAVPGEDRYTIEELPPDAAELQRREIQDLGNRRTIAALKGELPVDPAVEQDIQRGEAQLREELARRGIKPGSGDIYSRVISEFQRGANALRYGVRTGEMTTADALASNRQLELMRKQGQYVDQARVGVGGAAQLVGQGAGLYGDIGKTHAANRFRTADYLLQDAIAAGQGRSSMIGAGIGAGGTIIGATALAI
jgi:hypothetical protein